jgi:hypothetical protein
MVASMAATLAWLIRERPAGHLDRLSAAAADTPTGYREQSREGSGGQTLVSGYRAAHTYQ